MPRANPDSLRMRRFLDWVSGQATRHSMQSPIPYNTIIEALIAQAKAQPDAVYLHQPVERIERTWTWSQALNEVRRMAAALAARQFPPGSRIAITSKNCAHWLLADLA